MAEGTCTIPDCSKPLRRSHREWCAMHFHRWYRHGDPNVTSWATDAPSVSLGRRYRVIGAVGHPIAMANGRAYEHRVVLFDKIGAGIHPCHWCGKEVEWAPKGDPRCLQVDHLDADGANNHPDNLVPACSTCNTTRASQARRDALVAAGWWQHNDTVALTGGGRRKRVA